MTPSAFTGLCEMLIREGGLRKTLRATVEEQVGKTLYFLAHNVTNHELSFIFRRSGESISRHFHVVLGAIFGLYEKFIQQPDGSQVPFEIASNQRFYPYFKAKLEAADLRTKSIKNYDKLMMLYGKERASGKHAETGPDMLKRDTNKNLKRSSTSLLNIEEVDKMISINGASLENTEGDKQDEQSQPINDAPKLDVSSKVPTHQRNKISKHNHFEGMADMLRGDMDNLAHAINRLSTIPPISESEIWQMIKEMNFESHMNSKAYILICQDANMCRTLIGCPHEERKSLLLTMMLARD
ncbi:hypothetical protein H5410_040585 [Solanum commersonii]|uniref:DUF8040 domain-containing protein n=1 Tax=Solanum commersonii TaxID=4109 RepID=A0A9J5XRB4_SOLCO|nr:hypothetical protein H5410_040585 [Solanum commersonii]